MSRDDPVLAVLTALPAHDVRPARAERLRGRCHAALARKTQPFNEADASLWQRRVAPAVAALWSAVYVLETLRRLALLYRS